MARAPRDYRAEYQARIQRGLQRGLTRSQARGHGADRKGAVAASPRALNVRDVPGYLARLRPDRKVKIQATMESGRVVTIGQGKAAGVREYLEDRMEDNEDFADQGPSTVDGVVAVQVIYS